MKPATPPQARLAQFRERHVAVDHAGERKKIVEDLPALGGLGRPEEKLPIRRHTGIRGDADAPADWGWDVAKPVARMTVTPK